MPYGKSNKKIAESHMKKRSGFKMKGFSGFKSINDGEKVLKNYKEKKPGGSDDRQTKAFIGPNTPPSLTSKTTSTNRLDSLHRTRQMNRILGFTPNKEHMNADGSIKAKHFKTYVDKVNKLDFKPPVLKNRSGKN